MKHKLKKRLSLALSLLMIMTNASVSNMQDINKHWARETLNKWKNEGLLKGDDKGRINPDREITRAEFITMINKAMGYEQSGEKVKQYKDVKETDWYYKEIMTALEKGYIQGTSKDEISPKNKITRQEVMVIINKIANLKDKEIDINEVKDKEKIANWSKQAVKNMIADGYIAGYDGQIRPDSEMKRAEAVVIIDAYKQNNRTLSFKGEYELGEVNKLTINSGEIKLKNSKINQLIINENVKGKIELENVEVSGIVTNKSKDVQIYADKIQVEVKDGKIQKTANKNDDAKYKDGVYQGKASGYKGDIEVEVTIKDGKIAKIEVTKQQEDQIYWNSAKKVVDKIIEKQQSQVDASAGATISSKGIMFAVEDALKKAEIKKEEVKPTEEYKDGEYIGESNGFSGVVKVKVTIKDKKIEKIELISHSDDEPYMQSAKNIISTMKSKQKADVEAVSGATYSSKGLINAVKDALEQAKGKTKKPGQSEYALKNMGGGGSGGGGGSAGSKIEQDFTNLTDGEYEGMASGHYSNSIKVKVTVSAGRVTKIELLQNGDDRSYFDNAKAERIASQIIEKQSTKVDTISGATNSSKGFINAVVNALFSASRPLQIMSNRNNEQNVFDGQGKAHSNVEIIGQAQAPIPNVKLANIKVLKDLTIRDTMREGSITLENVTVDGNLIVKGGGENTVYVNNCTISGSIIIDKEIGNTVRVLIDDKTKVSKKIEIKNPAKLQVAKENTIAKVELAPSLDNKKTTVIDANVKELDIKTSRADILIKENSKIENIKLPQNVEQFEKAKTEYKNADNTFILKIEKADSITEGQNTNKTAKIIYGDSNVDQVNYPDVAPFIHPPFFNLRLKIVVDENNKIVEVANDETGVKGLPEGVNPSAWTRHKRYWDRMMEGDLFGKFKGKTLEEVKAMDMSSSGADVVSGATANCIAAKEAIINAFEGRKGRGFLKNNQTLTATSSLALGSINVNFTNTLPSEFKVKLLNVSQGIYNGKTIISNVSLSTDGTNLTIPSNLKAGHYFVNIVDESKTYRSPDFETGHGVSRHYPYFIINSNATLGFENDKLKVSDNDLANVFENVEHIIIKDKAKIGTKVPGRGGAMVDYAGVEIEPVGHHGTKGRYSATTIFADDGSIKSDAKIGRNEDQAVFEVGKEYEIEIEVFGYGNLKLDYTPKASINNSKMKFLSLEEINALDDNKVYDDGVYHAESIGFDGAPIPVKVTISGGKISNIEWSIEEAKLYHGKDDVKIDDGEYFQQKTLEFMDLAKNKYSQTPHRLLYKLNVRKQAVDKIMEEVLKSGSSTLGTFNNALDKVVGKHIFGSNNESISVSKLNNVQNQRTEISRLMAIYLKEELSYTKDASEDIYDVVSGATFSATAVSEAIEKTLVNADKSKNVDIRGIKIVKYPSKTQKENTPLDISDMQIKLLKKSGEEILLTQDKFEENGLKLIFEGRQIKQGDIVSKANFGNNLISKQLSNIKLIHEASGTLRHIRTIRVESGATVLEPVRFLVRKKGTSQWFETTKLKEDERIQYVYVSNHTKEALGDDNRELEFSLMLLNPDDNSIKQISVPMHTVYNDYAGNEHHFSEFEMSDFKEKYGDSYSIKYRSYNIYLASRDNLDTSKSLAENYSVPDSADVLKNTNVNRDYIIKNILKSLYRKTEVEIINSVNTSQAGEQTLKLKLKFADGSEKEVQIKISVKEPQKADRYKTYFETQRPILNVVVAPYNYESNNTVKKVVEAGKLTDEKIKSDLKLDSYGVVQIDVTQEPDRTNVGRTKAKLTLRFDDGSILPLEVSVYVEPFAVLDAFELDNQMIKEYNIGDIIDFTNLYAKDLKIATLKDSQNAWKADSTEVVGNINYADFKYFDLKVVKRYTEEEVKNNAVVVNNLIQGNKIALDIISEHNVRVKIDDLEIKASGKTKAQQFKEKYNSQTLYTVVNTTSSTLSPKARTVVYAASIVNPRGDRVNDNIKKYWPFFTEAQNLYGNISIEFEGNVEEVGQTSGKLTLKFNDSSQTVYDNVDIVVRPIPILRYDIFPLQIQDLKKVYNMDDVINFDNLNVSARLYHEEGRELFKYDGPTIKVNYEDFRYFGLKVVKKGSGEEIANNTPINQIMSSPGPLELEVYYDVEEQSGLEWSSETKYTLNLKPSLLEDAPRRVKINGLSVQ